MTKIGKDLFNSYVKDAFDKFKISKKYLLESEKTGTGVALIVVNENNGANAIAVAPEACNELTPDEVKNNAGMFNDSKVFLTQFESNLQATNEAINIASEKGLLVVLNRLP